MRIIRHGVGGRIEETLAIKKVDEEIFEQAAFLDISPPVS